MTSSDMLSINNVAAKLGLSVHQLRRWELMFGLEIKRGRGQQRQYREEDMSVLERIKELVEQGWPTSQIRPQLEAEGLLTPKLIGAPPAPGNPEVLQEAIIGLRNFSERRFIDLSKQIDELRQLLISVTLKQELSSDKSSPWQPMASEYVPAPKTMPAQEITIGPQISIDPPKASPITPPAPPARVNQIPPPSLTSSTSGYSSGTYPVPSAAEGGQRPIIGAPAEAKSMPNIDDAPKPITDALQRSMSTLDSLFKDSRNTPGLGTGSIGAGSTDSSTGVSQTGSTTSSTSVPAAGQPVRYSTIPPTPSSSTSPASPTTSTTSASQTPSVSSPSVGAAPWSSSPSNPAVTPPATSFAGSSDASGSEASSTTSLTGSTSSTSSIGAASPASPITPTSGTSSGSAIGSTSPASSTTSSSSAPSAPATNWEQAFTATSVDIDAAPSGLFESEPSAATGEKNPFTTITGTTNSAVDIKPVDSSAPALMGQPAPSSHGFAGNPLNQTGPLPAHTTVESFAPEAKEKLIASQSDSTSTDLPRSEEPESTEPAAPPPPPPPLPITAGPQVNFGPSVPPPTPQVTAQRIDDNFGLGEVTDQNYLTVLGRALDLIGWSDEQADSFSLKTFGVPHWDELGRSQAEKLVAHLVGLLKEQLSQ